MWRVQGWRMWWKTKKAPKKKAYPNEQIKRRVKSPRFRGLKCGTGRTLSQRERENQPPKVRERERGERGRGVSLHIGLHDTTGWAAKAVMGGSLRIGIVIKTSFFPKTQNQPKELNKPNSFISRLSTKPTANARLCHLSLQFLCFFLSLLCFLTILFMMKSTRRIHQKHKKKVPEEGKYNDNHVFKRAIIHIHPFTITQLLGTLNFGLPQRNINS